MGKQEIEKIVQICLPSVKKEGETNAQEKTFSASIFIGMQTHVRNH